MGTFLFSLIVCCVLYGFLSRHKQKRKAVARALMKRIWGNTGREWRVKADVTLLVPSDDLPRKQQWDLARSLLADGLISFDCLSPSERRRPSDAQIIILRVTDRGRHAFGFSERHVA